MLTSSDILLITGGTGSFGNVTLERFLHTGFFKEIRIFSRDEKKQDDMRQHYQDDKIRYYIGDVRDKRSLDNAMRGVDYVFHAAALKQVPSCEFFPMEAVRTNVMGCENVLDSTLENGVKNVVVLSTDKAVYPINGTPSQTENYSAGCLIPHPRPLPKEGMGVSAPKHTEQYLKLKTFFT